MPFPGSQQKDTVGLAWWIDHYRLLLRLLGILLVLYPLVRFWRAGRWGAKLGLSVLVILYAVIFYFFNFRFEADKMFYQPTTRTLAVAADNKVPLNKLVIGVEMLGAARAYPIQFIGYHHQLRDTIAGTPVMITYCTVCRTGRVFVTWLPDGHKGDFRLVGMDHFNAMFEDAATGSWWQQATGMAVAGPMKGKQLKDVPSQQLTLGEWLQLYPDSRILQPDTLFKKRYDELADYDRGTIKGSLERRDSGSWKRKSWVIGVHTNANAEKAYDWNTLVSHGLIQDTVGWMPVVLVLGADSNSYRAWYRGTSYRDTTMLTLSFQRQTGRPGQDEQTGQTRLQPDSMTVLIDSNTGSHWNGNGHCISGPLHGRQLIVVQSYQEFWHSWSHFHPATTQYKP